MLARAALRVLASGFAFLFVDFVANLVLAMFPVFGAVPIVPPLIALVLGGAAALWLWQRTEPRAASDPALIESTMRGAAILGGIGFAAGFFGLILFAPDANQGPLLGIFITGPVGIVLGAIAGYVRGMRARSAVGARPSVGS